MMLVFGRPSLEILKNNCVVAKLKFALFRYYTRIIFLKPGLRTQNLSIKMNKLKLSAVLTMALLAMALFSACGGNKTTEATMEDKAEEVSMQMQQEVNELKEELSKAQMQLNDQLAKISEKIEGADEDAKAKLVDVQAKLQGESEKLNNKMAELNGDLKEGWEGIKSDSKQLVKNIENSIKALEIDI
jgi:hypothetical protein